MDIQKAIETQIPDIHPVYGGIRGRTLSSRKQQHAWKQIIESGVKTIIDLRDTDKSHSLPDSCAMSGIEYFHYPVDNEATTIMRMVENLPEFCERIDRGDFYIACAMGLHRTDIALCVYWLFYGADRGLQAPEIVGYRQKDGHRPDKLLRVINMMHDYMIDNGQTKMEQLTFKERKQIILQMTKM